jgi:hypothetical protein
VSVCGSGWKGGQSCLACKAHFRRYEEGCSLELENGEKGLPHYQTNGAIGHAFWGRASIIAAAVSAGLNEAAEAADYADPTAYLSSGSGDLINHEKTWYGAYSQIDPSGPDYYEALGLSDSLRMGEFQGVYRIEGRLDSMRLDERMEGD